MIGEWLTRLAARWIGRSAVNPEKARAYLALAALHEERIARIRGFEGNLNAACWLTVGAAGAGLLCVNPAGAWPWAAGLWMSAVLTVHWRLLRGTQESIGREQAYSERFRARALEALGDSGGDERLRCAGGFRSTQALWVDVLLASAIAVLALLAPPSQPRAWRMPDYDPYVRYAEEIGPLRIPEDWTPSRPQGGEPSAPEKAGVLD